MYTCTISVEQGRVQVHLKFQFFIQVRVRVIVKFPF